MKEKTLRSTKKKIDVIDEFLLYLKKRGAKITDLNEPFPVDLTKTFEERCGDIEKWRKEFDESPEALEAFEKYTKRTLRNKDG